MARSARESAGVWRLSLWQTAGAIGLAGALVAAPIVISARHDAKRSATVVPIPAGQDTEVAPETAADGAGSPIASDAATEPDASVRTVRVVAASTSTVEANGIAVDAVDFGQGEGSRPVIGEVPELDALLSVTGNMMLRVRWAAAEGPVSGYRVACVKTGPAPAWVEALGQVLAARGNAYFAESLSSVVSGTEVYFNQQYPVPGAPYTCSVTPMSPNGDGATVSATLIAAPTGFDFAAAGPAFVIQSIVQSGGGLEVTVSDAGGGPLVDLIAVWVRCVDVQDGTVIVGDRVGSEVALPVPIGGVTIGHQYDCVAFSTMHEVSAVVRSGVVVASSGGVPGVPPWAAVQGRPYGSVQIAATPPAGVVGGTLLRLRAQCVHQATGTMRTVETSRRIESSNLGEWAWIALAPLAAGAWQCALAYANEVGFGPALQVPVTVLPELGAPSGFRFVEMDGANGVFRVRVADDTWDAGGERGLAVGCRNLGDGSQNVELFPLESLSQPVAHVVEFRMPMTHETDYRCEYATVLDASTVSATGRFGVPYEFTTPAASPGLMRAERSDPPVPEVHTTPVPLVAPPVVLPPAAVETAPEPGPVVAPPTSDIEPGGPPVAPEPVAVDVGTPPPATPAPITGPADTPSEPLPVA